jgi:hypothetical protein
MVCQEKKRSKKTIKGYEKKRSKKTIKGCGTVALYGLFTSFFFLADHRATDFTLSQIC